MIDYTTEDLADKLSDVDLVLDTVGGETQQRSFRVLRAGGSLVSTVSPPNEALAKAHNVTASFVFHRSDAGRLGNIVKRLDAGSLRVLVDRTLPLTAFGDAIRYQASARARGKIILSVAYSAS